MRYFDSNILLYAVVSSDEFGARAQELLAEGGMVSVGGLNEFVSVLRRKLRWDWDATASKLAVIRRLVEVQPLTVATHERGVEIAQRYGYQIFDALHLASALEAGARTLYSEDMQDGQKIEGLVIRNPFR